MVQKFAKKIMPAELHGKTRNAIEQVVRRFLHHLGLMHRISTHTAQRSPVETETPSNEFMEYMRQKVENMNPDHVVNMDQTPISFTFHSNHT